ncbi:MAG TPA: phage portal protein, partial [Phycisphaerae bacterium]|nr:phage portal protein [Phycisphaerae bacterium]
MLKWLRQLGAKKTGANDASSRRAVFVRGKYDSAQTTLENRRHWINADHLSANTAISADVRRTLRSRTRYEVANNSYAKGIVLTLANYVVGTGPRLQMLSDDPSVNRVIEKEFTRWAKAIGLAHKLRTMRIGQCESGECFGLLATNPRVAAPVQLDVRLIEADQVATPWPVARRDTNVVDGIILDEFGNPVAYSILRRHPGDSSALRLGGAEFDMLPADSVIHLFRADRPGQNRGVPEVTSSLSLFATLRRYTLAVLASAEQAALPSGVIYTDAPADAEAAGVEPMDAVEMDRGTWLTMPFGWKIGQLKAEQPTTVYGDFKHEVINEIARCLNMPFNIAAG